MGYVYIDMLKLAVPQRVRVRENAEQLALGTNAQYVALGSYDLVYYEIPSKEDETRPGLEWLEQRHELRHYLDWNYERHPVFLYAPSGLHQQLIDVLDVDAYPTRPLVLTMVRLLKQTLSTISGSPQLDALLTAFQGQVNRLLGDFRPMPVAVSWNLGNCDIMILSRPERLEQVRDLLLRLARQGLRMPVGNGGQLAGGFASFSSYCAFRVDKRNENRLDLKGLRAWFDGERSLEVYTLLDTVPALSAADTRVVSGSFVFGDRDYLLAGNSGYGCQDPFDLIAAVEDEMLDTGLPSAVRGSSLILSLPMPAPNDDNVSNDVGFAGTADYSDPTATRNRFISPLQKMGQEIERSHVITGAPAEVCVERIEHCINTLDALYKYAIRLRAAAYQDDIFQVIEHVFEAIGDIANNYCSKAISCLRNGVDTDVEAVERVAYLYKEIMRLVSELQHLYSILAVSPHSYMETYYGSMRSLNASSKLWVAYNGVIRELCNLFPTRNQEKPQVVDALLVPYRERPSESHQFFDEIFSSHLLVLVQLNYQLMFDAKTTIFAIIHELGHYIFGTRGTRERRARHLIRAHCANAIDNMFKDVFDDPLHYLATAMNPREALPDNERERVVLQDSKSEADVLRVKSVGEPLRVWGSVSHRGYQNMRNRINAQLMRGYKKAVEAQIDTYQREFNQHYEGMIKDEPSLRYCYGRFIADAADKYAREHLASLLQDVSTHIARDNAQFLVEDRYQDYIGLLLEGDKPNGQDVNPPTFDSYQISTLTTYWTAVSENGFAPNGVGDNGKLDGEPSAERMLDIFREINSDIFSCMVLDFTADEYLHWVGQFADSRQAIISHEVDFIRIVAVCEAIWCDVGCRRLRQWLDDGDSTFVHGVREQSKRLLEDMRTSFCYVQCLAYARENVGHLRGHLSRISEDAGKRQHLENIRLLSRIDGTASLQPLWRFWLRVTRETNA